MALDLGRTVVDGGGRVLTTTGGILLVGLLGTQLLIQSSINTAVLGLFPPEAAGALDGVIGLTLPLSETTAAVLFVGALIVNAGFVVVLSRALTRPTAELSSFPSELYTRALGGRRSRWSSVGSSSGPPSRSA